MFSHLASKGKQLIVLALLAGVLVMPISPLIADEIIDIAPVSSSTPVVLDIPVESLPAIAAIASTSDPVVIVATSTPEVVTPTTDQVQTTITVPAPIQDLVVKTEAKAEIVTEDSFTTLSDGAIILNPIVGDIATSEESNFQTSEATPTNIDTLAISDENPFGGVINTDNLAISEEQNWETTSDGINNPWAESAENNFTTLTAPVDTEAISNEGSFNTLVAPTNSLAVSGENSFVTSTESIDTLAVSAENNFTTSSTPVDTLAISAENNFTTLPGGPIVTEPAVSAENNFTTATVSVDTLAISAENNFTTSSTPVDTLAISAENNFTTEALPIIIDTLAVSAENNFTTEVLPIIINTLTVSDENSFTTEASPIIPPSGGGGGGGGGGYSSSGGIVLGEQTYQCSIYLKKFIKYGESNDRREVIKLQAFLKVYEGFKNLKVTGTYDRATFDAVKIFQSRYLRDVLKPWHINYATGWVYITTRQAINNIYCGRDTKNDLYFRKELAYEYYQATGENLEAPLPVTEPAEGGYYIVPTTTPTTTISVIRPNVFLAGVGELLNFIEANFCWLLNLLLLLLIFFLLWLLWLAGDDDSNNGKESGEEALISESEIPLLPLGAVSLEEMIYPEDEEELAKLAEEDETKLETLDNNPWQEPIILGSALDLDKKV